MTDEHLSLEARFQECEVPSSCVEERHILELNTHSAEPLKGRSDMQVVQYFRFIHKHVVL